MMNFSINIISPLNWDTQRDFWATTMYWFFLASMLMLVETNTVLAEFFFMGFFKFQLI